LSALLEAHALRCERDERLLFDNLHLYIQAGELLHIKGANGTGKTTLLRILAGLFSAYEGTVLWQGKLLSSFHEDYAGHVLYLGHKIGIKASLTPLENLTWYGQLHGSFNETDKINALHAVGLSGFENILCQQLSEGQKRRVALARLKLMKADLWILDEPFSAIDQQGVSQLENLLIEHRQQGGAVIFSTHQALQCAQVRVLDLEMERAYN
jgi:heme exporter protein A